MNTKTEINFQNLLKKEPWKTSSSEKMIRAYCLPVQLVQEGDDGDGKEPKPEEKIELLVHNVVRKNAHSVKVCLMAPTAKL